MKIDVSNTQDMPALSGSVKKASNTITKAEAGRIGKQVRAALKDAGIPTAMFSVSPGEKGAVVRSAFHPKTMSADFQNEKNYSRSFKAALKDAGLKVGGVKPVGGPGSKFMMEVKASASASLEDGLESESASKKQQENAKILFGSKGVSILSKLEDYSKEKQLHTKGIDYLISALKTKDTAALEKYASSAAGKKMVANVKKLASAKTFSAIMANIKSIKPNATLQKLSGATVVPNMRTQKPGSAPVKVGAVAGLVAKKLSPKYRKVFDASIGKGLTFDQEPVKEALRAIVIADKTNSKISDVYEYLDGDDTVSLTDTKGNAASPADVKPLRAMLTNGNRASIENGLIKVLTGTGLTRSQAKSLMTDLEDYDPYAQVVAALLLDGSSPTLLRVFDKGLVNAVKKRLALAEPKGSRSGRALKSGVTLSAEYANALPANVLKMLDSVLNPTLSRKVMNEVEEGAGSNVKGLGYAKIKKLIDALPATMKEEDNLPDWVDAEEEGSVTAEDVGGSGEMLGYYSPISRSAEFRLVVDKEGFREPGIVSIWS